MSSAEWAPVPHAHCVASSPTRAARRSWTQRQTEEVWVIQHTSDETVAGTIGSHGRSRLVVASLASDASDTCGGLLTDDHTSAESRSQLDDPPTKADDQT